MELKTPFRNKPGKGAFKTRPEDIRQWVADLPLANVESAAALLADALKETNALDIPVHDRFEALETFTNAVQCVTDAFNKYTLGQHIPLSGKKLENVDRSIDICNRMATGYKILVVDFKGKRKNRPQTNIAIHRAMRYLSEVLLSNYQIYEQYPAGIWQDIHLLYALSEQQNLTTLPVRDTTLRPVTQSTIGEIYKQILLLSLSCPYRHRQNETRQIYNVLAQWAPYSELHNAADETATGLFACNPGSDEPPSYRVLRDRDQLDNQWRILDTGQMAEHVHAALSEVMTSQSGQTFILKEETLQRLMLAWGVMPKRRFTRHQEVAPVSLVLGFHKVHHVIAEMQASKQDNAVDENEIIRDRHYLQDPTFDKTTEFSTDPAADTDTNNSQHGIHVMGRRADEWEDNPLRGAFTPAGSDTDSSIATPEVESWKMRDVSAGGYCLLWDSDTASSAEVGELLAMNTGGAEDEWQLGVIRWMKFTQDHGLELGIQMLSPGASAILTSIYRSDATSEYKIQGILLPEISSINQQASLLLPTLPFSASHITALENEASGERIRLTRLIENTGSFSQFNFTRTDTGEY